ncbi:phosphoadenosine phosphosulfate reductase [Polymorphobacter multimanifer]|uniref:Adenosine 5'-phosphosulfate reductase n=1 Tax=Polymorphobacter multimanifer TaxID=1070431 RepID=A0A841L9Y4_9SPHN|nr:phosphoadenylyl-sulfate reductase [Polymorphobacter multimanifer]MBB6229457.1 phosphoadenosine phosphosulfate reductase [Polymorphobacter multimanifer]GGI91913.1 phosphoadenosine phosphosulfate reductase [Polymorphobacter multimanifer]
MLNSPSQIESFDTADLAVRLRAIVARIPTGLVFTSSFGIEDQLLTHHILRQDLPIAIVSLDTGRLFPASYALWQKTEEHYGVRIRSVQPDGEAVAGFVARWGINGFRGSRDARLACCHARKVEPLARALAGASGWITGLRADQSGDRGAVALVGHDEARGLPKFSPLFDWSRAQVEAGCAQLDVPVNPLHAQGFVSIGCEPCTRAILPGESERAGRWWWEQDEARECGLHVGADGRLVRA